MDANIYYYSIYDRFIQRQPCACVRAFVKFFFKKLLFTVTEKSGVWSDKGAQVPLVLFFFLV